MNYRPRNLKPLRGAIKRVLKLSPKLYDVLKRTELVFEYMRGHPHEADFLLFKKLVGRQGLFLDVGANVGQSAISFASINKSMRIISFEPNVTCEPGLRLVKRVLGDRYSYHMTALGPEAGQAVLHVPMTGGVPVTQEASILEDQLVQSDVEQRIGQRFTVRDIPILVRPLDSYGYRPLVVKIDVQGFEMDVLRGMPQILAEDQPLLLIESGRYDNDVTQFLGAYGYRPYHYNRALDRLEPFSDACRDENLINIFYVPDRLFPELFVKGRRSAEASDNGMTMGLVFRTLGEHKKTIGYCIMAALFLSYAAILVTPRQYTVTMAIAPAESDDNGGGLPSSLAGAASLLGGKTGAASDKKLNEFLETIHSVNVSAVLLKDNRIMQHYFAREWNPETRSWHPPRGFFSFMGQVLQRVMSMPAWTPPSPYRLADILNQKLQRRVTLDSDIVRIVEDDRDPEFGVYLMTRVTGVADDIIRQRNQARLDRQKSYLQSQVARELVTEYRIYLLNLMSQNDKQLMRLSAAHPYSYTILTPPYASDRPTTPNIMIYLLMGLLGGFSVGSAYVLYRHVLNAPQYDLAAGQ